MVHLQLFLGSEQVELHDNESIVLTLSLQDVKDIKKIYTDYSRTFNVPASKINNKIFKHFYNPNIRGFDVREKKSASLFANYKPFKDGFIRLESVQMHNNKPKNYRITFFGSLITFENKIGDAELKELSLLGFSINYSPTNILAGLQNGTSITVGGTQIDDGLLYPLISAKDRWIYNSADNTASSTNIHYGSNSKGIFVEQLKPAIRIHAIIKAIEKKYNITFSEDFFSNTNTPYYNLYLWLNKQKGVLKNNDETRPPSLQYSPWQDIKGQDDIAKGFYGGGATTFFAEYRNQGSYSGNRYLVVDIEAPLNKNFTFKIEHLNGDGILLEQDLVGTGNTEKIIKLSDGQILKKPYNPWDFSGSVYHFTISGAQDATIKVTISVFIAQRYPSNVPLNQIRATSFFNVNTTSSYFTSPLLEMPKIKIMDFLTGLFKMFNLTATFVNDVIKVQTLDEFYSTSTTTYDITKFLDKTNSEVSIALPYKNISFSFKGRDSFFSAFHEQINQIGWGSLIQETKLSASADDYQIQLPFEHHKFERLVDTNTTNNTSVQWGWSVNQDQEEYVGQPLLFYPHKITSGDAISVMETVGGTHHSVNNYYIPSNTIDPTDNTKQSIHFGAEKNEYVATQTNNISLYETYYKSYIEETLDESRRLFKFVAYLPQSIIYNIKLNDKIIIFTTLFKINKLTTDFQNNRTTLELINELEDFNVSQNVVLSDLSKSIDTNIITVDSTLITADNTKRLYDD